MPRVSYTAVFQDLVSGPMAEMSRDGQTAFRRMDQAQDQFSRGSRNTRRGIDGITKSFGSLTSLAGGLLAGFGFIEAGRAIVNTEAKFARFEAVLTNSLGSKGEARKALDNLKDFASTTPFQIDQLTDSYIKFVNRGFKPSINEMTSLGDLASSTGKEFDQLTEAILDAQTGEFERLKEFGIRASKSGDQVAFTFKGVTKTVGMSDKGIKDYLISLGKLEGVQGSMAAISATSGGKISNLQDNVMSLAASIGESLRPIIHTVIDVLAGLVQKLSGVAEWLKRNQNFVKDLAGAIGIVIAAFAAWRTVMIGVNLVMAANPIGFIITAVAALTAGVLYLWNTFEGFRGFLYGLWGAIKTIFAGIKETVMNVLGGIGNILKGIFTQDWSALKMGMKELGAGILKANPVGFAVAYGKDVAKGFNSGFDDGVAAFREENQGDVELSPLAPSGGGGGLGLGGGTTGKGGNKAGAGIAGVAGDSRAAKNLTININKLVESLEINTTNLRESGQRIREEVTKALLTAVNDVNIING